MIRDGRTRNGKQRFSCHGCGRTFRQNPQPNGYSEPGYREPDSARILRAYEERSSLRGVERTFGVSRQTVAKGLKKRRGTARRRTRSSIPLKTANC